MFEAILLQELCSPWPPLGTLPSLPSISKAEAALGLPHGHFVCSAVWGLGVTLGMLGIGVLGGEAR